MYKMYCKTTHTLFTSNFLDSAYLEMLMGIKHFRSFSDARSSGTLSCISSWVRY